MKLTILEQKNLELDMACHEIGILMNLIQSMGAREFHARGGNLRLGRLVSKALELVKYIGLENKKEFLKECEELILNKKL